MSSKDFVIENGVLISYKGSDESVEIPSEVEKIGAGAFKNNRKIKEVVFACKNLKSIEEDAFYDCTSLEGIKIPEGTVQIAKRAFIGCANMEYIYIPSSVMIIGDIATESSVAVFGSAGSEAEKYAKTRLATFRTDFLNGLKLINNKKLEKENVTNRTFNVFGEEITVSSSLKRYHEILEYYNRRQEEFFDEMMTAVPKDYTFSKKVANGEPIFMGERKKTVKRLEESGIYISEGELNSYTYDSMKLIGDLFGLILKAYTELHSSALSDMKNQVQRFYDQAESQVTGLSYGYIGGGVGLVAYAFDDFLEKQKQRKRAYAVAEQQKTTYVNAQTAELNKTYAEFYNRFVPLYKKATDAHIEALFKCELDYYIKHGLIEADIKDKYDVVKSSELMQGLYEKNSPNAEYVVALALKLYPMNVSAHIYAIDKEISCDGLEELRAFLGLNSRLQSHKDRVRNEKFEKVSTKVCNCSNASCGIGIIEENTFLTEDEIKKILTRYSVQITQSVKKITEDNPGERINVKEYCEQKLDKIISRDSWTFFEKHRVAPIKSNDISQEAQKSFAKLVDYLEKTINSRQNEKAAQLKSAEEALNNAKTIEDYESVIASLVKISGYKNANEFHAKAIDKKRALERNMLDEIKGEISKAKTAEDLSIIEKKINRIISSKEVLDALSVKKNEVKQKEKKKKLIKIFSVIGAIVAIIIFLAIYDNTAHYREFKKMTQTGDFNYDIANIDTKLAYDMSYRKWACKTLAKRLEEFQENDDIKSAVQYIYESGSLSLYANESFMDWLILGSVEKGECVSENEYVINVKNQDFQKTYLVFWEKESDASRTFYISEEVENWDEDDLIEIDTVYREDYIKSYDMTVKSYEVGLDIDYSERMKKAEEKIEQYKLAAFEAEQAPKKESYEKAVQLLNEGKKAAAAIAFAKAEDYLDARERSFALWDEVAHRESISIGNLHTIALKSDGTVVVGHSSLASWLPLVSRWGNIVDVSSGDSHVVGLKSDGTVVSQGYSDWLDEQVSEWKDIVSVSAGDDYTVGIKYDGTVVAVGENNDHQCDVEDWTDIIAVSTGRDHTVGLKADGTVVAVGYNGDGKCNVGGWTDIVAVSAGYDYTLGLKSDGTVVAVGYNENGQCDVGGWTDIVAVSTGIYHSVGLKSDGTVVSAKLIEGEYRKNNGQCDVSHWTDIVAVYAGHCHTIGLKSNGSIVAVGDTYDGRLDLPNWNDIKIPNN